MKPERAHELADALELAVGEDEDYDGNLVTYAHLSVVEQIIKELREDK